MQRKRAETSWGPNADESRAPGAARRTAREAPILSLASLWHRREVDGRARAARLTSCIWLRIMITGVSTLLGSRAPVRGEVSCSRSHALIALRSYSCPSAVTTGSRMSMCVIGHTKAAGNPTSTAPPQLAILSPGPASDLPQPAPSAQSDPLVPPTQLTPPSNSEAPARRPGGGGSGGGRSSSSCTPRVASRVGAGGSGGGGGGGAGGGAGGGGWALGWAAAGGAVVGGGDTVCTEGWCGASVRRWAGSSLSGAVRGGAEGWSWAVRRSASQEEDG